MIFGSCLCKQVQYQVDAAVRLLNNCHCSMCRKVHGAAFVSFLHADLTGFKWLCGLDFIKTYRVTNQDDRNFCINCGSNIPVIEAELNNVIIPAGTLDTDPGIKPSVHIFTGSKAPWFTITDVLPQFENYASDEWIDRL